MNNGDKPASPTTLTNGMVLIGLTKREEFAIRAMQGILANPHYDPPRKNKLDGMAIEAIDAADALLAALEKDNY